MRMNHAHLLPILEPTMPEASPLSRAPRATASPKRAVNLTLSADAIDMAKKLGINMSQTVDAWFSQEVKRQYWEQWREENREAFAAYNARIEQEGLPLAKYRTWGTGLSTGKKA
jgi:antitoxin CcdA